MAIPAEGDSVRTRPLREWSLARPRCVLCWKHFRQVPLMVTRERTPTGSGCNGGGGHPLPVRDRLHARLVSTQTPFAAPQLTPILMPSVAVADDPIIEGLGRPGGSVQCTTNGDGYTAILRAWTSQVPPPGDGQRVSSARDARTHLTRHASLSERSNHRQLAPAARGDGDRNCLRQSTTLVHTPANGSEGVHPVRRDGGLDAPRQQRAAVICLYFPVSSALPQPAMGRLRGRDTPEVRLTDGCTASPPRRTFPLRAFHMLSFLRGGRSSIRDRPVTALHSAASAPRVPPPARPRYRLPSCTPFVPPPSHTRVRPTLNCELWVRWPLSPAREQCHRTLFLGPPHRLGWGRPGVADIWQETGESIRERDGRHAHVQASRHCHPTSHAPPFSTTPSTLCRRRPLVARFVVPRLPPPPILPLSLSIRLSRRRSPWCHGPHRQDYDRPGARGRRCRCGRLGGSCNRPCAHRISRPAGSASESAAADQEVAPAFGVRVGQQQRQREQQHWQRLGEQL